MEENKLFYDLYGYQFNPIDVNNWMVYQQPCFNYPFLDGFSGNFGIGYNNYSLQNDYEQLYLQGNYHNNSESNVYYSNSTDNSKVNRSSNKNETYKKSDKSPRFQANNYNSQRNNQNKLTKNDNSFGLKLTSSVPNSFEILNRNKKSDEEKFRKAFSSPVKIDLDKDFPPIMGGAVITEPSPGHMGTLDYRLALQKPKSIIKEEKINKGYITEENNTDKVKKKRKRNRKKKAVEKPAEPFSFVDEEFPCLDTIKFEDKPKEEKSELSLCKDDFQINKAIINGDRKKFKKRQLLFILPGDMEGQVRVIQAPIAQKNKTKRKVNQDRLKKPIGILNPLDLSAPLIKRGKERLKPKAKKPSKLKKTILHYRNLKKELREKTNIALCIGGSIDITDLPLKTEVAIPEKKNENMTNRMHSKHFREYCNHMVDNKINSLISQLLKTLIGFQDKLYNRDPLKAKLKRRLCFGLREVTKFVNMKKLRLIIIAPDLEKIDIEGGLDDIVSLIIKGARESGIPYVFGLSRSSLAYLCYKKFRVGAIGIFNYEGAEVQVKELLVCVDKAREQYNQIKQIVESISQDVSSFSQPSNYNNAYLSDEKYNSIHSNDHVPYKAGHSRTPSNALSEPISDIGDMNKLLFNSIIEDQINSTNSNSDKEDENLKVEDKDVNEEANENKLIDEYVENILISVSKLNFGT